MLLGDNLHLFLRVYHLHRKDLSVFDIVARMASLLGKARRQSLAAVCKPVLNKCERPLCLSMLQKPNISHKLSICIHLCSSTRRGSTTKMLCRMKSSVPFEVGTWLCFGCSASGWLFSALLFHNPPYLYSTALSWVMMCSNGEACDYRNAGHNGGAPKCCQLQAQLFRRFN